MRTLFHLRRFTKSTVSVNRHRGFSLLELMIVLAISAILASVAMPSFQDAMLNAKRGSITGGLIGSLQLARSEAIKQSTRVSVCARQSDTVCGTDWGEGWLVFTDAGATIGSIDADETILQVNQEISPSSTLSTLARISTGAGAPIARPFVRFTPRGATNWRGAGTFLYCDVRDEAGASALNVTLSGDVRRARKNTADELIDAFGTAVICP